MSTPVAFVGTTLARPTANNLAANLVRPSFAVFSDTFVNIPAITRAEYTTRNRGPVVGNLMELAGE